MKIVIDIDEKTYDFINNTSFVEDEGLIIRQTREDRKKTMILFDILDAVRNGTPLPKGHGNLIDINEVIKSLFDYCNGKKTIGQCIDDVQTIIEAEYEEVSNAISN